AWALFGALPLLRAHLHRLDPEAWPEPASTGDGAGVEPATAASGGAALLRVGCWAASILALAALGELFSLGRRGIVPLFLACAAAYLALAWRLAATRLARDAAAEVASGLLALAIVLFFLDERAFLPLAVLGAAMHLADGRWRMPGLALLSHGVFALLAGSFVARAAVLGAGSGLGVAAEGSPFGTAELTVLGAIIVSAITSLTLPARAQRSVYLFAAHVAFLVWLAHQLAPLELGQELISLCWGVYGIVLLLVALQRGAREAQLLGLGTLGVVALKLVAVDMAQVDVIWRILLFMGFGAAFLGLSYLINRHAAPRG
ncbi:MAG TPA: DUF2339 domain-containing protein, partial [Longimicrobiales bacterium]|nr:DUF2339 domain-containing protein [Longimicrobiales bacterium]